MNNNRLTQVLEGLEKSIEQKIEKVTEEKNIVTQKAQTIQLENNKIKSEGIKIINEIKSDLIKIKNIIN